MVETVFIGKTYKITREGMATRHWNAHTHLEMRLL